MKNLFFCLCLVLLLTACNKNEEPKVQIETTEGTLVVQLYKETPKHRDNFLKLVKEGYYDNQLLFDLIPDQMVKTGDPNSVNASHNRLLGRDGVDYEIEPEINYPKYFHKRGVLSACLTNSQLSHGSQFMIVLGHKFSSAELDTIELDAYNKQLDILWQRLVILNRKRIDELSLYDKDKDKLRVVQDSLVVLAEKEMEKQDVFFFTQEQRKAYTSKGGVPAMDKINTVFGEVVEGFDVLDKIEKHKVDRNFRPEKDIRILSTTVID